MNRESYEGELIWEFFGRRQDGFFVEVGANDPKNSSQTWFIEERGWRGILVEPLKQARPNSTVFQVACGAPGHPPTADLHVGENSEHSSLQPNTVDADTRYVQKETVRMLTLDEVLEEAGRPKPDFVSIDVEGLQLEVLKGFSLGKHRPGLLFIEDHMLNWKTHRFIVGQGYLLVKRTQLNNWYVPADGAVPKTTFLERLRLWRKIWPGTPARMFKAWLKR